MYKAFIFTLICLFAQMASAQQMDRVNSNTDSLCAPYMHGRGYTFDGDFIAARFIEKHFVNAQLQKMQNAFFQHFQMEVNTFPSQLSLSIDGKKMRAGEDFIAHALSGSGVGKAKIFWISEELLANPAQLKAQLPKNIQAHAIAYFQKDEAKLMELPQPLLVRIFMAGLHISVADKLTHTVASQQYAIPKLLVSTQAWPKNAKKLSFNIQAKQKSHISQNVIGYVKGTAQPDSFVVFTAHYDHLGTMGKDIYFAGANDNASGIAMLLELAYHYASNPAPYSVAFMAFGAEEAGLVGSKYYTEHPLFPLAQIRFLINMDLMATGEKGMTAVNATEFPKEFALLQQINQAKQYLPEIKSRGTAANSDHHFFYQKGVPSFFFYLMGNWPHYHDVNDKNPIPYTEFKDTFRLIVDFVEALN